VRREALKKRKQATAEHQAELEGFGIACTTLCEGGEASLDAFVEILVDEKLLLPSNREYVFRSFDAICHKLIMFAIADSARPCP